MNKRKIITIAGVNGSGKSSTGKGIASELGYKHFSSGDFMRKIATEENMTLEELGVIAENNDWVDKKLDAYVKEAGKENNIVIDSRLAFHWLPASFKIFLDLDSETAAERMLDDMKNNPNRMSENTGMVNSREIMQKKAWKRLASERKRYLSLYGIKDHTDRNKFDLVVDTKKNNLVQVIDICVEEYKKWLEN